MPSVRTCEWCRLERQLISINGNRVCQQCAQAETPLKEEVLSWKCDVCGNRLQRFPVALPIGDKFDRIDSIDNIDGGMYGNLRHIPCAEQETEGVEVTSIEDFS